MILCWILVIAMIILILIGDLAILIQFKKTEQYIEELKGEKRDGTDDSGRT